MADSDSRISIDELDHFRQHFARSPVSSFLRDATPSTCDETMDSNEVLAGHLSTAIDIIAQIAQEAMRKSSTHCPESRQRWMMAIARSAQPCQCCSSR
jgi:phosphoketolase